MIEVKCPHCEKVLHIPDIYAEHSGVCNSCHSHLTVPPQPCKEKLFKTCEYFSWTGGNIDISTFRCRVTGVHGQEIEEAAKGNIPEKDFNSEMCLGCTVYKHPPPKMNGSSQTVDFDPYR